jgi:hypothetical protein
MGPPFYILVTLLAAPAFDSRGQANRPSSDTPFSILFVVLTVSHRIRL